MKRCTSRPQAFGRAGSTSVNASTRLTVTTSRVRIDSNITGSVDNITHTLVGITLVRAGLGRRTPGAMPAMIVASNAPDFDIVAALTGGALPYLAAHRGPTHGILGIIVLALVVAAIVWLAQ